MPIERETIGTQRCALHHRVEHVDTDSSGVVHFSRYASLIETAALETLADRGAGLGEFQQHELDLCVRELRIRYLAPAYFRDCLLLEADIEHLGEARVRLAVRVLCERGDTAPALLATGNLDLAIVDRTTWKATCIPDDLKTLLQGALQ
jgi:acyl-CoA thioester hydrolase